VAGSTAQDPALTLVRTALEALADEPVRVLATTSGIESGPPPPAPANAVVADWVGFERVLDGAALMITNGGHGTVASALAAGVPVLVCPDGADQPENGARVAWAGAGLTLPRRLLGRASLRLVVRRAMGDRRFAERARELAAWSRRHDGPRRGAELVEAYVPR
jgi:UDP:flavonoid glycosyltransferase YjiC (YdhE family)